MGSMSEATALERTVNNEIHLIATAVARIETKLDMVIGKTDDHEIRIRDLERACQEIKDRGDRLAEVAIEHRQTVARVGRLERTAWFAAGAAAALGGGAGAIAGKII
jgi:hypothetical protein